MTDLERETIAEMAVVCDGRERLSLGWDMPDEADHWRQRAATLRGLLTGGDTCSQQSTP